jgi:N-methylhydantoinase B/oxoprolinase/acetone carboxylase alpha subunit
VPRNVTTVQAGSNASRIPACWGTKDTPIEALERAFPMRVLRYTLRRGSGGAGCSPGGEGIERGLQMLEDVTVSLTTAPKGLATVGPRRR